MPMLTDNSREDFRTLLAHDVLDASKGALMAHEAKLQPDDTNRTILIGIGGTGVRTIDYVKGAISKRLDASWKNYVAFLGIDTDWKELDGASYLEKGEQLMITKPGVADRMSNPQTYPAAIRRFAVDGERMRALSIVLPTPGAGQTRLAGKIKVHDRIPGSMGMDEEIVYKLSVLKAEKLAPLTAAHGKYQIYVIGSGSGGTGSGTFMEMPALIRKAFSDPSKVTVNGMLYLPDTLAMLDPANMTALYANGYGTLKELNYYMGMYMRPEYAETWSFNDAASPELTYKTPAMGREGFMNIPYLIGTTSGPAADANRIAQETISEFLISLLAKITTVNAGAPFLTESFLSNATNPKKVGDKLYMPDAAEVEAVGEAHEFPKRFSSIGFAEASVPQKLVRAYTVGKVCEMAGLAPVSAEKRISLAAGDASVLLPFRGKDDLLNATEGTAKATKLLEPISKIMAVIHSGNFSFGRDLNEQEITWTKVKNRQYDNPVIAQKTEAVIKARTDDAMMDELKKKIKEAFSKFRENVQDYVREEGPYAFANLYEGRFIPVGDNFGTGIGQMLQNLVQGRQMDGKVISFFSVEDAKAALDHARNAIVSQAPGLFGIEGGVHKDQCSKWVAAYDKWGTARINKVRRDTALGAHGALSQSFLQPAAKLAEELEAFGCILEIMADVYKGHGRKMESYEEFSTAQTNLTEVNLAAMSDASYKWLLNKANGALAAVNGKKLRDSLVNHFFDKGAEGIPNSRRWLEYEDNLTTMAVGGQIKLVRKEMPVPARVIFDEIMAEEFPSTVQVSIEEMFKELQKSASIDSIADNIITKLYAQSKPQFNGDIPTDCRFGFIMYPSALEKTSDGKQIADALETAAKRVCPGVAVYATDDAQSIMFYQQATTLEVYRLADLKLWEQHYENGNKGIQQPTSLLHGLSPDLTGVVVPGEGTTYTENTPWADYPALTVPESDPRLPDPETGIISREGKIRLELDKLIARARELGVLYSEQTPEGWIVKRVHCNKATDWRFATTECSQDPATGLLPLGKELAEAVASQNGQTLEQMSRKVALNMGGLMSKAHISEDYAWQYAARTLRAHMPMYIEVRETVKKFEAWAKDIEAFNATVMATLLPAKLVWLVKGRILRRNEDGTWVYIKPDGKPQNVAVLTEVMKRFLPPMDKLMIENDLLTYYLFGKMETILRDQKAWNEAFKRAQDEIQNLAGQGAVEELTMGEETAAVLLAEIQTLIEKGGNPDGSDHNPTIAFTKNMPAALAAKLKDIELFYHRLGMWEIVF